MLTHWFKETYPPLLAVFANRQKCLRTCCNSFHGIRQKKNQSNDQFKGSNRLKSKFCQQRIGTKIAIDSVD